MLKAIQLGQQLTKKEMKEIKGAGSCAFSYLVDLGGGSQSEAFGSITVTGTCAQQMAACKAFADGLAVKKGPDADVHYDSGCDGWGH